MEWLSEIWGSRKVLNDNKELAEQRPGVLGRGDNMCKGPEVAEAE